jgi:hypothetical protein
MSTQIWPCSKCGVAKSVEVKDGDGVMAVVHRIELDHKTRSPNCDQPYRKIRILQKQIKEIQECDIYYGT